MLNLISYTQKTYFLILLYNKFMDNIYLNVANTRQVFKSNSQMLKFLILIMWPIIGENFGEKKLSIQLWLRYILLISISNGSYWIYSIN